MLHAPGQGQGSFGHSKRSSHRSTKPEAPVISQERRTTVVFRNLPKQLSRKEFLLALDDQGFAGRYDFVYVPLDFAKSVCFGYAVVNFVEPSIAHWATLMPFAIEGRSIRVDWSTSQQGLQSLIERYRKSFVTSESVKGVCKPLVFVHGSAVPFPTDSRAA